MKKHESTQPELIPVLSQRIGDQEINAVNARELHNFLESKREFTTWIKDRIEKYGFNENVDYCRFDKFVKGDENGHGNKTLTEYALSIRMAKELAMIENNDKGREARKYFILCEEKYQQAKKPLSIEEQTIKVISYWTEKAKELETKIETDRPKVEFFDAIADATNVLTGLEAARILGNVGRNRLYRHLRSLKIFLYLHGKNVPYGKYIERGYFEVKPKPRQNPHTGENYIEYTTFFTAKGIVWLEKLLKKYPIRRTQASEAI